MRRIRRCVVAGVLAISSLAATPAVADNHHQLRTARHHAARLDARARAQHVQIVRSRVALARLDRKANAALNTLRRARDIERAAQAASDAAEAELASAQAATVAARARLDELMNSAYRTSAAGGTFATTMSLVQDGDAQSFLESMQVISVLGRQQSGVVDDLRIAQARQLRLEELAAAATARAQATARVAAIVKQRADQLVHEQQRMLHRQQALLRRTQHAAAAAHHLATRIARRIAAAEARAAAIRRFEANAVGGALAKCNGGSVSGYSNGNLPIAALCPLWDAPGMMLQKAAAASFNGMSQAYAAAFGTPLCVTSSYRTYQRQVELYATMPAGYAAVPGTSNHGWALAVDLCGGIQVDFSPQHQWLLDHAASYGWFHPAWALPGGAGPHEPWHWEYAG